MSGFRTFLKLGELPDGSIEGLFKGGYELEHCTYNFSQGIDEKGETQTEIRGGTIVLSMRQLPTDEIIRWSIDSRKYLSGVIVLYDENNMPLEKTFFKNAACVSMKIDYEADGSAYIATFFTIQAETIVLGNVKFENRWTI